MSAAAKTFTPTPEQVAIGQALKESGNIAINAGAGTGKTSTLMYLVREHIPRWQSTLLCVFNKRNQEEMAAKLAQGGAANTKTYTKTFAGMGRAAFVKKYDMKGMFDIDSRKYRTLARWWVKRNIPANRTAEQLKDATQFLLDTFTMFMVNTTRHHETGELVLFLGGSLNDPDALTSHSLEKAGAVIERYTIHLDYDGEDDPDVHPTLEEMAVEDAQTILSKGVQALYNLGYKAFHDPRSVADRLTEEGKPLYVGMEGGKRWVDFIDMQYWCVVEKWSVFPSKNVLVDESQDLSPMERALVDMHVEKDGRVIIVGDDRQAIYAFKGADNEGFYNSQIFWGIKTEKPLSVCWRCCKAVVELASDWKPGFQAAPNAIQGFIAKAHDNDVIKLAKDGDAVISRLRAPMIGWWREFIKAGIPAYIVGQNPADPIVRSLEKIAAQKGFSFANLDKHIDEYQNVNVEKMRKKNRHEMEIMAFVDDMDLVRAMVEDVEASSLEELISKIKYELDPRRMPEGGVAIMTGHGAKGGEWNQVFCVTPKKFPLKYKNQSPADLIQEKNLTYVMQTRAKQALFLVDPDYPPYDPAKPVQQTLPKEAHYDEFDDDDDTWEDPVDEGFEMPSLFGMGEVPEMGRSHAAPTITVEPVPVLALPAPERLIEAEVLKKDLDLQAPTVDLITFADAMKADPDKPLFEPLLPRIQAIDEAQGIVRDVSPVGEKPAETPADPVVEEPKFKASGDIGKDMKAFKANQSKQAEAQSKVFDLLKKLDLDNARAMRDLLEARIEELEADLEPV